MPPIPLSRTALPRLADAIARPTYDLAAVRPGIVHLGLGGFHRAHMARYTHDLMARRPDARGWGIVGAGLLPTDRALQEALAAQDRLYSLVERGGAEERVTVIGSLAGLAGADDVPAAIDGPDIRIVSLTVTANGYGLNSATKALDPDNPAIARDLADLERPRSAIGVLVEALRRRKLAGRPAFSAMSCDNIQGNGQVLRRAVLAFAGLRDPALADWISAKARFPSTMVDRITPVTTPADIASLAERHDIADRAPVVCEPFIQWVIEDDFADGRPDWDAVGAQFVADVAPYELMKLRLLNASHLAVAGLGRLIGYRFVDEAMGDGRIHDFMRALMDRETGPTLQPVPGVDLAAYKRALIERFANPAIKDTVERINTDAPLSYLLDPIRDRLRAGASVDLLSLALAAWMRRVRGVDEAGAPIDVRHPLAAELRERAIDGGPDPTPLFGLTALFGDLGASPALRAATGRWLASLYDVGAAETLARAMAEDASG
ncbi:MAG: mannitol dehydrogenase family protein [Caulobacteraceae bacterium]